MMSASRVFSWLAQRRGDVRRVVAFHRDLQEQLPFTEWSVDWIAEVGGEMSAARAIIEACQGECDSRGVSSSFVVRQVNEQGEVTAQLVMRLVPSESAIIDGSMPPADRDGVLAQVLHHKDNDARLQQTAMLGAMRAQNEATAMSMAQQREMFAVMMQMFGVVMEMSQHLGAGASKADAWTEAKAVALDKVSDAVVALVPRIPEAVKQGVALVRAAPKSAPAGAAPGVKKPFVKPGPGPGRPKKIVGAGVQPQLKHQGYRGKPR